MQLHTFHLRKYPLLVLLGFVVLTLGIGFLGGILGGSDGYATLTPPPLAPPSAVFPIVWSILYVLMGVGAYLVWKTGVPEARNALKWYFVQLAVNALWPLWFFRLEWRLFAFFWILLLIALFWTTMTKFRPLSNAAFYLLLPTLLWSCFAAYLNLGFYLLNR